MTRSPPRRFPGPVRTPGFVGGVKAAALLLGVACAALVWAPWHGAVVLSVSASHGIDVGDLPALALVAVSVAILHARAQSRNTPAGLSWLAGRWTAPASAVALGALLLLVGPVDTYGQWSLVPAGGGTFDGSTQHADGRRADPLDRWTHVALTYDMRALRLYVDGTEASHRAMTGRTLRTTDPLWIGGNRPYGEYFQGVIDEVRVYDRALGASEVRAEMSTPVANRDDLSGRGPGGGVRVQRGLGNGGRGRLRTWQRRRDQRRELDVRRPVRWRDAVRPRGRGGAGTCVRVVGSEWSDDPLGLDPAERVTVWMANDPASPDGRLFPRWPAVGAETRTAWGRWTMHGWLW